MIEGFADGDRHILGLRKADQGSISRINRDLCFMAVFLDGEDYLGLELVAQDFADFGETSFHLLADGVGDFELSSGVFDIHDASTRLNFDFRRKKGFSTTK
jgi:hypothetical protein